MDKTNIITIASTIITLISCTTLVITTMQKVIKNITNPFDEIKSEIKSLREETNANISLIKDASLCTLRQSLLKSCEDYMDKGSANMEQKESTSTAYESYKALGGNTFITTMVKQVQELPLKSKATRRKANEYNQREGLSAKN